MDPITQLLSGLGPWGLLAAAVLGFVGPKLVDLLKKRFPQIVPPAAPPPAPSLLDQLVQSIKDRIRKANPAADPDQAVNELLARELVYGTVGMPPAEDDAGTR